MLAIGIVRCASSQIVEPARAVPASQAPATIAEALAQAGYVAIPFSWARSGHQLVDATIDTMSVTLNLDSGFSGSLLLDPAFVGASGIRMTDVTGSLATVYGTRSYRQAFVDRIAFGSVALELLEASMLPPQVAQGYLGMAALSAQAAIIDFVTDTLYLLAAPSGQRPAGRHVTAPNLRALLEVAGHYGTFLMLMQEAGLLPLLEGKALDTTLDSLTWEGFRIRALQQPGLDTMPDGRERVLKTRQALNERLRQDGQLTAFVPTDAAFAQLTPEALRALRADRTQLARVLRAHLLTDTRLDTLTLRTFIGGASQPEGAALGFYAMGPRLDVARLTSREDGTLLSRATIVDPNLSTATGIAHGIDRVLLSPSVSALPAATLASQGYVAIPLYRHPNGWYVVRAKLNGTPVTLAVDTGAPCEIAIGNEMFERLLDQDLSLTLDSATTVGVSAISVDLKPSNQKNQAYDVGPIDGILGSTLLSTYHAYLDYATATLYLALPTPGTP